MLSRQMLKLSNFVLFVSCSIINYIIYFIEMLKETKLFWIFTGGLLFAGGIFVVPPLILAMLLILFIFLIGVNIYNLEKKYQNAQTSADFFHTIIDHTPLLIFWKDRQSIYRGCNTAFATWIGLKNIEAIEGKTDFDFFQEAQAAGFCDIDQSIFETGKIEERLVDRPTLHNGQHLWRQTLKMPLYNKQNQIIGVIGYSEDITHRHQLEMQQFAQQQILERQVKERTEELRNKETFLRSLLDNIPLLVFWKNPQLQFLGCNLPFACTVGVQSPQQIIGRYSKDLAWREHPQLIENTEISVLNSEIPDYHRIEPYIRVDQWH